MSRRKTGGRTITSQTLVESFQERECSRRSLLKGAAALASATLLGCGSLTAEDASGPDERADDPAPDAGSSIHRVGMGWSDTDYLDALELALAETAGLSFIAPGDTVYFKVNCNSGDAYPHSTNPDLIRALVERCRDHGAERVIVGDRSFWGDRGTLDNMHASGVGAAAEESGAELIAFEDDTVDWVQIPAEDAPHWVGGYRLPLPVVEADHIINLPLVKTHFISTFTMALKNVLGLPHPVDRAREGNLRTHGPKLWNQIAEVNLSVTPSLNILDGYRALITGGPNFDSPPGASYADPQVIVASPDRIATDVVGVAILQTLSPSSEAVTQSSPWTNPQIAAAIAHDLGVTDPNALDLSGPSVPQIEDYRALLAV